MAIDPHGRFGPLLIRFLPGTMPVSKMIFDCNRSNAADGPNAAEMYRRLIIAPSPSGIFITTTINRKKNKTTPFSVEPTQRLHQLHIPCGFGLLFRQGSKQMGIKPQKFTARVDPIIDPTTPELPSII